jgi:choline dehydrogenase-like flavoprotein
MITEDFASAIEEVGISISPDQANGNAIGGFYIPHNQDPATATRSSAREAYYDTVETRGNLHLITGQQVTRILTDVTGDTVTVTGVEVRRHADCFVVYLLTNYTSLHLAAMLRDRPLLSRRKPYWPLVPFSHRRSFKSRALATRHISLAST